VKFNTRLATVVLSGAALLGSGSLTHAHAHLEKAVPANGSILTAAPPNFVLTFSEPTRVTVVWLQRGTEPKQKLGSLPTVSAKQTSIPAPPLTPGTYELTWRAVSDDGHVVPGKTGFSIAAR